ncbi:MAG: transcriptional regulator [Acetatifactor sp.]|nr:transcriptional regulator [Acetatifactor sp.]
MSVRSAKDAIKEARIKAGLTQEQLAEGVCSVAALSKIETGLIGVSPSTFQALMDHAGASCERYPLFANKTDFECFYALRHVKFHLDAWQLQPTYTELKKIENTNWANNKFYYQEWLLYHCLLQFKSYNCDHQKNYTLLMQALHISRPCIDLSDFQNLLLTRTEIMILIAISQEALYLAIDNVTENIYHQLSEYLSNSKFDYLETERLLAEATIPYCKYLIHKSDYEKALEIGDLNRHRMVVNAETSILLELTFLCGVSHFFLNHEKKAHEMISAAFYSAHALGSCYATACKTYLIQHTKFPVTEYMEQLDDIPTVHYPLPQELPSFQLGDGTFDILSNEIYTLGSLIKDYRIAQHISQQVLCYGLCSKSKLSKIENGTLQPDIALAEVLLQRLGVSERIFTFWGDEKDAKFYDLKFKLIQTSHYTTKETYADYLDKMQALIDASDHLYRQQFLSTKLGYFIKDHDAIPDLLDAIRITIPNFNIHNIMDYRLGWEELSILNILGDCYRIYKHPVNEGYYFFHQLMYYSNQNTYDIMLRANYLAPFLCTYIRYFFSNKDYKSIISMHSKNDDSFIKHRLYFYGFYCFYYCQALEECQQSSDAYRYGVYSCNIQTLYELFSNSKVLQKGFQEDYSVKLVY